MYFLTEEETAQFKAFKQQARAARTAEDILALKAAVAAWVAEPRSAGGRQLRLNMSRAIRGAYAQLPDRK